MNLSDSATASGAASGSHLALPGPSCASLCPAHATAEVSESRGELLPVSPPRPPPRYPSPFYSAPHERWSGRTPLLRERTPSPTDPASRQPRPPPPPSIRCVSARRGRRGARAGAPRRGLTCRAPASRRAAAAGGGLRLRARQCGLPGLAPRRGGGAEGGPAEVGLAQGGNGGDAITKPVRPGAGRTAPPWTGEALHHAGPWEGAWPPTAAAPAARTANVEPARGSPEPAPKLRCPQSPSRARHCGATLIGAPRCPGPSQV